MHIHSYFPLHFRLRVSLSLPVRVITAASGVTSDWRGLGELLRFSYDEIETIAEEEKEPLKVNFTCSICRRYYHEHAKSALWFGIYILYYFWPRIDNRSCTNNPCTVCIKQFDSSIKIGFCMCYCICMYLVFLLMVIIHAGSQNYSDRIHASM